MGPSACPVPLSEPDIMFRSHFDVSAGNWKSHDRAQNFQVDFRGRFSLS